MINTYWGNNGKHQKAYDEIFKGLVPLEGKCATQEGEALRAVTRIYYDCFNNGFGNNWSGPLYYLTSIWSGSETVSAVTELGKLHAYSTGKILDGSDDKAVKVVVELLVDAVLEHIMSKNGQFAPNDVDMFEYSCDDEEEEDYNDYDYEEDDC